MSDHVVMLIPSTRPVSRTPEPLRGNLDNFVCYGRFIRLIEVVKLETIVTITATITLEYHYGLCHDGKPAYFGRKNIQLKC